MEDMENCLVKRCKVLDAEDLREVRDGFVGWVVLKKLLEVLGGGGLIIVKARRASDG